MAPEYWLIDEPTQEALARVIDAAADAVINNFDNFGNENSLTAALGQELLRTRLEFGGTSATFLYRNFLELREEPVTGADGGIVVTIKTRDQTIKMAVLFQAKRFPQDRGVRDLSLPRNEARRLTLGTFLGKSVARCTRGDRGPYVVQKVETPFGFVRHQLRVNVTTDQPPMLARGDVGIAGSARFASPIPVARRRL